jgi:hypothetical protein
MCIVQASTDKNSPSCAATASDLPPRLSRTNLWRHRPFALDPEIPFALDPETHLAIEYDASAQQWSAPDHRCLFAIFLEECEHEASAENPIKHAQSQDYLPQKWTAAPRGKLKATRPAKWRLSFACRLIHAASSVVEYRRFLNVRRVITLGAVANSARRSVSAVPQRERPAQHQAAAHAREVTVTLQQRSSRQMRGRRA